MKVLVLSETDASSGPMAAAFLRDYSTSLEVVSAGRNPSQTVDPLVVTVMKESLVDLEGYVPHDKSSVDESSFDLIYEVLESRCPKTLDAYRHWRDDIKNEAYLFWKTGLYT